MSNFVTLALISICVGMLVGAAGIGGFFMAPALVLVTGVGMHQGMATALFTFIFTGLIGTHYFHKKGTIDWRLARPLCLGAALTGFGGAWIGTMLSATVLSMLLGVVIMAAGIYAVVARGGRQTLLLPQAGRGQWLALAGVGAASGFLSGLTGIGGPALSVPLMVLLGFSVLTAIGIGQVLQIVGALSGTLANLHFGHIDYRLALFVTVFEVLGVLLGAYITHRVDERVVRRFIGALCLVAGSVFIWRAL
ncbi:MAG TPA: sulfite exporter TauE/SafE family protein [Oxalicibacterium sp.]